MADESRVQTGKVILLSAAVLAVLTFGVWLALPATQYGRQTIVALMAAAAIVDVAFGLFLLTRS